MANSEPIVQREEVVRLWLHRQGLSAGRVSPLTKRALTDHLERVGGLQIDTINALDRAHYLTLWSRFGPYERERVDRWIYRDRAAFEYWGHEASIRPISHLPLALRRMRRFPPEHWKRRSWWSVYATSGASKRRVLGRIRAEGPLESLDFERDDEYAGMERPGGAMPLLKEDKRSLKLLWHDGRVAVHGRRKFRIVYDLAERIYPDVEPASPTEYEDSWLLLGLSGNGIATEKHLTNYITAPDLRASQRKQVITRNLRKGRIVKVRVDGVRDPCYALPEHLDELDAVPEPRGTTLICPFDSLLWQRQRAADLLDFEYRVEIYVPAARRQYGYYVLPILHDGRLVGRLDPKLHRDREELQIKSIHLEPSFERSRRFDRELSETLHDLGEFVGAETLSLPRPWSQST